MQRISEDKVRKIKLFTKQGKTAEVIAKLLGISTATVYRVRANTGGVYD
ncbi:helix-turn-helix domain-containing protein [Endozoicomonas sp. SESOKO1]